MKCASCQKELTGRQTKYCDLQCQRKVDYENFKDKATLEKRLIAKRKKDYIEIRVTKWKGLLLNSSENGIRKLINLKPIEIKQADNFRDLLTYI